MAREQGAAPMEEDEAGGGAARLDAPTKRGPRGKEHDHSHPPRPRVVRVATVGGF